MMDNELYAYSPLPERSPLRWPDGARVAFFVGLNIEHFRIDRRSTSIEHVTAGLTPDPMNYGWRDYGVRVGIWRVMDLLDEVGIRPSVLLNSDVCDRYPQIIRAGVERDWVWCAHGSTNSELHSGYDEETERQLLADMIGQVEQATGRRPRGWLGPALTETFNTPRLLRELGLDYVLDWCCDEQPFDLEVEGMISVPYSIELNDITAFVGRGLGPGEWVQMVLDQLEGLLADGEQTGRVLALPLHPFLVGQPFRAKYLRSLLREIVATEGVWVTTSDGIADHYLESRRAAQSFKGVS